MGTGRGSTFQISSQYCATDLSELNFPIEATVWMDFVSQLSLSANVSSSNFCASRKLSKSSPLQGESKGNRVSERIDG